MKVAVAHTVTREWLKQLPQSPDTIIYRKVAEPALLKEHASVRWIDCSTDLAEGIRYGYLEVRRRLEEIRRRHPRFFRVKEYDFFEALNKDVFWAMFDELLAERVLLLLRREGPVQVISDFRRSSFMHDAMRLLRWWMKAFAFAFRLKRSAFPALNGPGKIAIRINHPDVFPMLGKLPEVLGADRILYFASDHQRFAARLRELKVSDLTDAAPFVPGALLRKIRGALRFSGLHGAPVLLSKYARHLQMVSRYEHLCRSGVQTILVNACENEGEGNIASQVAHRSGIKAMNFMNGTKAFDAVNAHTEFDLWFLHDEKMQDVASAVYGLGREKIPVTGHLLEDIALNYRPSGLLDPWFRNGRPRMVITFFPSDMFFADNAAAYEALQRFLDGKDDVIVFVKPHPRDADRFWNRNDPRIVLLDFREQKTDSETALFDLLSQSDAVVSVASTVSFQAAWFKVPSITFELSEQSRLPYTDGVRVQHVNDPDRLLAVLQSCYVSSQGRKNNVAAAHSGKYPVAEKIAAFLQS